MTTFALIYTTGDFQAIADQVNNPGMTNAEKTTAGRYINGGLRNWATAPYAGDQYACVEFNSATTPPTPVGATKTLTQVSPGRWRICDSDIRAVVVTGAQVSKQGLIDFLRLLGGKYPSAEYMLAIADDLVQTGVEPWP